MFKRYRERLEERLKWVNEMIDAKQDYTTPETINIDPKTMSYAKTIEEAKERFRVQVKYELELLTVNGVKEAEIHDRLKKRYRNLMRYMAQVDKDDIVERYLECLSSSYDPHTSYMSPKSEEQFRIDISSSLEGVGALLGQDDGVTTIKEIVPGGVIARDGRIKVGDRITAVGEGESGEMIDIDGLRISAVVHYVRGKAGTKVRLEVQPANSDKRNIVVLTRARIELEDRRAKGEVVSVKSGDKEYKVGVLNLPSFYADDPHNGGPRKGASTDCRRIINDFKKAGIDGMIVDLRNNGGGLLNEAVDITGLFIDQGPVVQVKDFRRHIEVIRDENPGMAWDGPLVVLVNRLSASASEIFAGAIQDYHRGLIVGDSSTHGKGSVQRIFDLAETMPANFSADTKAGSEKLTLQMFYRINGDSTQRRGVVSDIVLPAFSDRDLFSEAKMDYALPFDRIKAAEYLIAAHVNEALAKKLKQTSEERRAKDADFAKYAKQITRKLELVDRKSVTFTEASLRQQRKDIGEEDQEDEDKADQKKKEAEKFGTEAYTREVLNILGDLIRESAGK